MYLFISDDKSILASVFHLQHSLQTFHKIIARSHPPVWIRTSCLDGPFLVGILVTRGCLLIIHLWSSCIVNFRPFLSSLVSYRLSVFIWPVPVLLSSLASEVYDVFLVYQTTDIRLNLYTASLLPLTFV